MKVVKGLTYMVILALTVAASNVQGDSQFVGSSVTSDGGGTKGVVVTGQEVNGKTNYAVHPISGGNGINTRIANAGGGGGRTYVGRLPNGGIAVSSIGPGSGGYYYGSNYGPRRGGYVISSYPRYAGSRYGGVGVSSGVGGVGARIGGIGAGTGASIGGASAGAGSGGAYASAGAGPAFGVGSYASAGAPYAPYNFDDYYY